MTLIAWSLLAACLAGILMVFGGYSLLLTIWTALTSSRSRGHRIDVSHEPRVSLIVVARNAEALINQKLENCLNLDYPKSLLQVIACSDGSTDRTAAIMQSYEGPELRVVVFDEHVGKIAALNKAASAADHEILVFTDADAILADNAIRKLVRHFADPAVGGVCGQRLIANDEAEMADAQQRYIGLDSGVKVLESRLGRLTSNDGKLYAVRRSLFQPIAAGVTDDLYACLSVIRQGARFVFEPEAFARIRVPSRSIRHELARRQRIVTQSLQGLWQQRALLNPFRYGLFSLGLLINKVFRRLLPFFAMGVFLASLHLAASSTLFRILVGAQILAGLGALFCTILCACQLQLVRPLGRIAEIVTYVTIGNLGMLLGVLSFLSGRRVEKWNPVKSNTSTAGQTGESP